MRDFFEMLSNRIILLIFFIAAAVIDYFAYLGIQKLPKPETFRETLTYYFNFSQDYLSTLGLSFLAFTVTSLFAIGIGSKAIFWNDIYDVSNNKINVIQITLFVIAVVVLLFSFYFISYALWLLFVILVVGAIVIFFLSNSGRKY